MLIKKSLMTALTLSLVVGAKPAVSGNEFIPGLIIGGILGAGLSQNNRDNRVYRGIPSTQEGKDIQTSLNYFGFPAGVVDGQLGQKSRAAISNYQTYMGFEATGNLTEYEQDFLISSYQRAQLGGPVINQVISQSHEGTRALLYHFRDEMNGTLQVAEPQGGGEQSTGLPSFFGAGQGPSLSLYCSQNVQAGVGTLGGGSGQTDPATVLGQQFCLARDAAARQGNALIASVQGATPQQIEAQCAQFGPAMADYVGSVAAKPVDAVLSDVGAFVQSTGMSPTDLVGTAKICLAVGYRTDDDAVALGSALLLTALGNRPYGELVADHLALGFGIPALPDAATGWYQIAFDALEQGAPAVFEPNNPERVDVVYNAAHALGGGAGQLALPLFNTGN